MEEIGGNEKGREAKTYACDQIRCHAQQQREWKKAMTRKETLHRQAAGALITRFIVRKEYQGGGSSGDWANEGFGACVSCGIA